MKQRNTKRFWVVGLAAVLIAGLLAGAVFKKEPAAEDLKQAVVVETETPIRGDLAVPGEFIATVEPSRQVAVLPKATGEVLAVHFGVGDVVEEGDVLFEIDSAALKLNLAQTQAAISSAQAKANANLELARQNLEVYQKNIEQNTNANVIAAEAAVKSAENGVQTAQVALSAARRALRDHRDMDEEEYEYTRYPMTGIDYDNMTRQYRDQVTQADLGVERAEIALEQARETHAALLAGLDDQEDAIAKNVELAELSANLSDQYIAIQNLQRTLEDYSVKAPIGGVVEQRSVDVHDFASPQQPAFIISQKEAMTVTFQVSEAVVSTLQIGDAVLVEKQEMAAPGTIYEISSMVNVRGGLYTVKATVANAPFEMRSGSAIKVIADTKKASNALLLPIHAVYFDEGDAFVYAYREGILHKVPVRAGIADDLQIEIVSGLDPAEQVVTTWNSGLRDGLAVIHSSEVASLEENTVRQKDEWEEVTP